MISYMYLGNPNLRRVRPDIDMFYFYFLKREHQLRFLLEPFFFQCHFVNYENVRLSEYVLMSEYECFN